MVGTHNAADGVVGPVVQAGTPRLLPPDVRFFTGRAREPAELDALLDTPGPQPS